jgi:hypothetical protein
VGQIEVETTGWPAFDAPLLQDIAAAFRRRSKSLRYRAGLSCGREFTGAVERLVLDLRGGHLRLSVWADGRMWLSVCVRAPGRNGGLGLQGRVRRGRARGVRSGARRHGRGDCRVVAGVGPGRRPGAAPGHLAAGQAEQLNIRSDNVCGARRAEAARRLGAPVEETLYPLDVRGWHIEAGRGGDRQVLLGYTYLGNCFVVHWFSADGVFLGLERVSLRPGLARGVLVLPVRPARRDLRGGRPQQRR